MLLRLRSALAELPPGGSREFLADVVAGDADLKAFELVAGAVVDAAPTPGVSRLRRPSAP